MIMPERCPCDTGLPYADCCGPYHQGLRHASTALALMRSRYSAVALGKAHYMTQTIHRDSPYYDANPKRHRAFWAQYSRETTCCGLTIVGYGEDWVQFQADLRQQEQPVVLSEKSYFVKLNNRWLYLKGDMLENAEP